MKISIITPSFNSGSSIKKAIKSVIAQNYDDYEHIIVDGGSTDSTLDIIKRYPHLKWVSEPDRGQVHALSKGFAMSTGEIIGCLNADDYYLKGAFSAVIPHFHDESKMVMGKVLVHSEKPTGINEWTCDPRTDFSSALHHWEPNAFCVNPVGYFYLREVQEKIPLKEETGAPHDLEFLIEAALHYPIKKIDAVLGVFNHAHETQTGREQLMPSYWQPKSFPFVERLAKHLPEQEQKKFKLDQERGYQLRRQWTVKEAFARGMAEELFDKEEVFMLPEDENDSMTSRCGFVEHDRIGTKGDWIIPVIATNNTVSKSICNTLKTIPKNVLPAEVYHVSFNNKKTSFNAHSPINLCLRKLFDNSAKSFYWKFIICIQDPIERGILDYLETKSTSEYNINDIKNHITTVINSSDIDIDEQFNKTLGINILDYKFNFGSKYTIISDKNIEILIYRSEDIPNIFSNTMKEYLGIPNIELKRANIKAEEPHMKVKDKIRFDITFLKKIYSSKYARHFYKDDEISVFLKKWENQEFKTIVKPTYNHNVSFLKTGKTSKPVDYIIFFVPRSGSTLLADLLTNTKALGNPLEWLNPDVFKFIKKQYGYDPANLDEYLKTIRQEQRTANGVFGIEIANYQFGIFRTLDEFWKYFDKNSKVLFVRRDNFIEQSISLFRAKSTQTWHVRNTDVNLTQVNYDGDKLIDSFNTIINEEVNMINWFMDYNIHPLILTYENIVKSHTDVIKTAASYIGINLPSNFKAEKASLKKIIYNNEAHELQTRFIDEYESAILDKIKSLYERYTEWEKFFPQVLKRENFDLNKLKP